MAEITIQLARGAFSAYLARPSTTPVPAVIVAQEIFGVNRTMRAVCDRLASAGFIACCPDLFWRIEPGIQLDDRVEADSARAFELFQSFDAERGVADLRATLAQLRDADYCTEKVGVVGYCLGGELAYLMAARADPDCSVGYYGVGIEQLLDEAGNIDHPLMLHIAGKDAYVPPAAQSRIQNALAGNPLVTLHLYPDQDHGFARQGGAHHDAEAAGLADARTLDFLKEQLL